MEKRFVSIWFRHLTTDWFTKKQPVLRYSPFVLSAPLHGRMIINATNDIAEANGIERGMVLADARAIIPGLKVLEDMPGLAKKLLQRLAEWCIRFTPSVAIDPDDGLMLDATGCSHLWGGDAPYLSALAGKLNGRGYDVCLSIADTPGVA